jgi:hypothetical protein
MTPPGVRCATLFTFLFALLKAYLRCAAEYFVNGF